MTNLTTSVVLKIINVFKLDFFIIRTNQYSENYFCIFLAYSFYVFFKLVLITLLGNWAFEILLGYQEMSGSFT